MEERERGNNATKASTSMERVSSDATGSLTLTIWGNHAVTKDKWYQFLMCQCAFLMTKWYYTPLSRLPSRSEDAGAAVPALDNDVLKFVGEIVSADVTKAYLCPKRHLLKT